MRPMDELHATTNGAVFKRRLKQVVAKKFGICSFCRWHSAFMARGGPSMATESSTRPEGEPREQDPEEAPTRPGPTRVWKKVQAPAAHQDSDIRCPRSSG